MSAALSAATAQIAANENLIQPLPVGATIPDVHVNSLAGDSVSLKDIAAGKPTVLIFYRGGWCPYCRRHLAAMAETEEQLVEMGYQIIGISADPAEALAMTADKGDLSYRLFSDHSTNAAQQLGIAFKVDNATILRYQQKKLVDLDKTEGVLPVPAVIIVDANNKIRFFHVNPNYRERLTPEEVEEAARLALETK